MIVFLFAMGCGEPTSEKIRPEPTFIEATGELVGSESTADGASSDSPLPYSNTARTINVSGIALDRNADPYNYSDWVEVSVRPGTVLSVEGATEKVDNNGKSRWYVQATDGSISTTVQVASAFGDTHVWLSAVGDPEALGEGGSYATGVTEAISIHRPTITELQDVSQLDVDDAFTTSPLFGEFVTIRTDDRDVVVTALTTKGFWVSDLGDAPGNYSGLFVYTFNKPENVKVGDRIGLLAGGVQEYVGATQLSFPLYEAIEGETLTPPDSAILPADELCDGSDPNNAWLEAYESSIITIESATIPANFQPTEPGTDPDPDYNQFLEYGQWPVELASGCRMYVVSRTTVPQFDPVSKAGQDVGPITGVLSYVRAGGHKWMLLARDADDIPAAPDTDSGDEESSPEGPPWPFQPRSVQSTNQCDHSHDTDSLLHKSRD